jgi:hypothetical protein
MCISFPRSPGSLRSLVWASLWSVIILLNERVSAAEPLRLHPENPHYFLFRGKPTVLVGSTEHYGSVINPDFDYVTYLDTIQKAGLNLTRTVNGLMFEAVDAELWRGGHQNPLAPRPGRYLGPWARSDQPGYFAGGNKFDLTRWDEAYFKRLRDFVRAAHARGIIVEFNAFYSMYAEGPKNGCWVLNPLNERNNINAVGKIPWNRYCTMDDLTVVSYQAELLRRTLRELNEFDNVYYEIVDEPYFSGATTAETAAWQDYLIDVFVETERSLPQRHLIAWNYANDHSLERKVNPHVSVMNFHYCTPPSAVPLNWQHNRVIGFDETLGVSGVIAPDRRREAWAFFFSGGATYDNLDPSFATDDPTGSGKVKQPDGTFDGREVRAQLGILLRSMQEIDFIHMGPRPLYGKIEPAQNDEVYCLEHPGEEVAIYLKARDEKMGSRRLEFELIGGAVSRLPIGSWSGHWLHPRTGERVPIPAFEHKGGTHSFETPQFSEDIALWVKRIHP